MPSTYGGHWLRTSPAKTRNSFNKSGVRGGTWHLARPTYEVWPMQLSPSESNGSQPCVPGGECQGKSEGNRKPNRHWPNQAITHHMTAKQDYVLYCLVLQNGEVPFFGVCVNAPAPRPPRRSQFCWKGCSMKESICRRGEVARRAQEIWRKIAPVNQDAWVWKIDGVFFAWKTVFRTGAQSEGALPTLNGVGSAEEFFYDGLVGLTILITSASLRSSKRRVDTKAWGKSGNPIKLDMHHSRRWWFWCPRDANDINAISFPIDKLSLLDIPKLQKFRSCGLITDHFHWQRTRCLLVVSSMVLRAPRLRQMTLT